MSECFPDLNNYLICDLGGSIHFWEEIGLDLKWENISIYNINDNEVSGFGDLSTKMRIYIYDGFNIPVEDDHFDLLICNSVIEHVPRDQRRTLVKEMRRVAKKIFCQTPAVSGILDAHFMMPIIHWLPKYIAYYLVYISPWKLLSKPSKGTIDEYFWGTNLLYKKEIRSLFPNSEIYTEKFLCLPKSYYIIEK